jgi:hypothetical protein
MRLFAAVLIVAAVLVDGFFAFVNFYPVAPARGKGARRVVLTSLPPNQAKWLSDHLIAEFNAEHNTDIVVQTTDEEHMVDAIATANKNELLLASLPSARGSEAISRGLLRSFEDAVGRQKIDTDLSTVRHKVMRVAQVDGKQYFLPRFTLLDLIVYRVSRVRDAVRNWQLAKDHINAALKRVNGRGLPEGYHLELEPEHWDAFDRFVVAWYWAHRKYNGKPAQGRIAHRVGEDLDAVWDIAEGVYRAGANDKTFADTTSLASRDYFAWEVLYRQEGLFHPSMFDGKGVDDERVLDLISKGEINLATIDQMEAFTLHGGSHIGTPPKVEDPDDLAFSPMPRISSLELDETGKPKRTGQPFSFREDWVWALPKDAPDVQLAYDLVMFFWDRENHRRECEALGTIPLRMDVTRERASLFRLVWMDDIFDAVFAEWEHAHRLPQGAATGQGSVYAQLWDLIVAKKDVNTPEQILAILKNPPQPRAAKPPPPPKVEEPTDGGAPADLLDQDLGSTTGEEDDEDAPVQFDDELWRGKVELDLPPLPTAAPVKTPAKGAKK